MAQSIPHTTWFGQPKSSQTKKPNLAAEFLQQAISKQKYAFTIILVLKRNHKN